MFTSVNNKGVSRTFVKFHHTVLHMVISQKTVHQKLVGLSKDTSDAQIHTLFILHINFSCTDLDEDLLYNIENVMQSALHWHGISSDSLPSSQVSSTPERSATSRWLISQVTLVKIPSKEIIECMLRDINCSTTENIRRLQTTQMSINKGMGE